jgi:hypothetical protein
MIYININRIIIFLFIEGSAADAPQPWGLFCNPVMKIISFFVFPCNGAPVDWNWQGKTEVLGENPVPMPLCPPQIVYGLTRASAVRGRRLTAWAMAGPVALLRKLLWQKMRIRNSRKIFEWWMEGLGAQKEGPSRDYERVQVRHPRALLCLGIRTLYLQNNADFRKVLTV